MTDHITPQPPVDRAALRDRIAETLDAAFQSFDPERTGDAELAGHLAAAVLAVLPEPADRAADDTRDQLLAALDFSACQTHGYSTPEDLLAAYDASQTAAAETQPDRAAIRAEVLNEQGPEDQETLAEAAEAYRWLRPVIEATMTDSDRWDGDESEEFHLGRYVQWLAAQAQAPVTEAQAERLATLTDCHGGALHCGHYQEGDGDCCRCGRANWCPDQGVAAAGARQDDVWPVKDATRSYAEELRSNPSTVVADGHAGWACDAGAQLLVGAETPGPGKLGTHHGVIYACPVHQGAALQRITGAGFQADPQPAPPGHRWNPWPCGHVTAHSRAALTALTVTGESAAGAQQ